MEGFIKRFINLFYLFYNMISEKGVLDFTKKMILLGDIVIFVLILFFIYLSFFTGSSNSIQVYNLDEGSERRVNIVELDSADLSEGREVSLDSDTGAWVYADEKYYTFELSEISPNSGRASLYIENLPLNVVFETDQERSFDLNSDGYYDVSVYLKDVSQAGASFLFKESSEKVQTGDSFAFWLDYLQGTASKSVERQNYFALIFYSLVFVILLVVLYTAIPIIKDYLKLKKIKGRKSYSEVLKYLVKQFNENKKYDSDKAKRIYKRIRFIYSNLNPKDKKKFKSTFEKIKKEVSE